MILGFRTTMRISHRTKATNFEKKIVDGIKIHTIRQDSKNRWRKGKDIHFALGVRTPKYRQFHTGKCTGIQFISINYPSVMINDVELSPYEIEELAINDGFDTVQDFWDWFKPYKNFEGKLIHWTDYRYRSEN